MKRLFVVMVVVLISTSAPSYAQSNGKSNMPEKVRQSLERLIGTWNAKGFTEGKAEYRWDLSKKVVIGWIEFEADDSPLVFTSLWYWDKKSEDGLITSRTLYNDLGVTNTEFHGKVLPGGTIEEKQIGEGLTDDLRIEHQSPNQFTIFATNIVERGDKVPDFEIVFTRSNATGRGVTTGSDQVLARNKATLRRYFDEIFNKRDLSNAHEFISPNLHVGPEDQTDAEAVTDGDPEYVAFFKGIFAMLEKKYEANVEVREIVAEGNRAAALYRGTGLWYPGPNGRAEQNAVGVPVEMNGMGLYEFDENGLIVKGHPVENAGPIVKAEMEYAQKQQSGLESRNKAQVKRLYDEVVGKMDLSKAHEILSPKMTLNGKTLENGPIEFYRGIFEMAKKYFDEITVVQDHMIAEGNWVARRYSVKFTYYPGGKTDENAFSAPVKIKGMGFYEFDENGLIIQNIHIEDTDQKLAKVDAEYDQKQQ